MGITRTKVIITAIDPKGRMAILNLSSEEAWIPLSIEDIEKMKEEVFRPSQVLRIEMTDEPYNYHHDSQHGTIVWKE